MFLRKMLLIGVVALTIPTQILAYQSSGDGTEGTVCEDCVRSSGGARMQNNLVVVAQNIEKINDNLNFAGQCSKFAEDGRLGAWAKSIRSTYMNENLPNLDRGSEDIHKYCPTYSKMKETDKANFWVLVLNAMAHFENSCNTSNRVAAQGPNGKLVGILQLHSQKEGAYVPRGSNCYNGDGKTAEGSFRCAMIMLNSQLKNQGALFARGSYWDVLRPQAKSRRVPVIVKAIRNYAPCQDESKLNALRNFNIEDNTEILNALQYMDLSDNPLNGESYNVNDLSSPINSNGRNNM